MQLRKYTGLYLIKTSTLQPILEVLERKGAKIHTKCSLTLNDN